MRRLMSIAVTAGVAAGALAVGPVVTADAAVAGDPFEMTTGMFADPASPAARWVAGNAGHASAAAVRASISAMPMARWFTGTGEADIGAAVARYTGAAVDAGDRLPMLVAANLPGRDACGDQPGGGASDAAAYLRWISAFAAAIGDRPAIVVLEPGSLGEAGCMSTAQIAERNSLLTAAGRVFAERAPNTWAYLDGAGPRWATPAVMAQRLRAAGLAGVRGFAVNVSGHADTASATRYATELRGHLGTPTPYVIDTGRNGIGHHGAWCNPAGLRLGARSTSNRAALQLWIANPGTSDGPCGIAPTTPAGAFDPFLATRLITGG